MLYPLEYIQRAATLIYGRNITSRTWRRWKRICKIGAHKRSVSYEQAVYVLTLAYLRRKYPRKLISIIQIKDQLKEKPFTQEQLQEALNFDNVPVLGKELPNYLRQRTGRQVTLRTLYRWAQNYRLEFGASRYIPAEELNRWVNLA